MITDTFNPLWICLRCIAGILVLGLFYVILDFIMRLLFKDYPVELTETEEEQRKWDKYSHDTYREYRKEQEWQEYLKSEKERIDSYPD